MYLPSSEKHFVNQVIGFPGAEESWAVGLHPSHVTSSAAGQEFRVTASGENTETPVAQSSRWTAGQGALLSGWESLSRSSLATSGIQDGGRSFLTEKQMVRPSPRGRGVKNSSWLQLISSWDRALEATTFISGCSHQRRWNQFHSNGSVHPACLRLPGRTRSFLDGGRMRWYTPAHNRLL